MPTSIAITIARQLEADPDETDRVLEDLVQSVRHDVARDGQSVVPGLGTFRLFDETIVFEPDYGLALAVNHRYAGLESLLINGQNREAASRAEKAPESGADIDSTSHLPPLPPASPEILVPDDVELPDSDPTDMDQSVGAGLTEDAEPYTEEGTGVPPPEDTELVPVAFATEEPETAEVAEPEPPVAQKPEGVLPETASGDEMGSNEREPADAVPDILGEFASSRPAVPSFDESGTVGEGDDVDADEEASWAAASAEEDDETHLWPDSERQEETAPPGATVPVGEPDMPEPHDSLEADVYPEPPELAAGLTSASPFFEPWPEDPPRFEPEPSAEVYPDAVDQTTGTEVPEVEEVEAPITAPGPDLDDEWNAEESEPERSAGFRSSDHEEPAREVALGNESFVEAPAPEAAETYDQDPLATQISEPEVEVHRRSAAGWLVGAIALIALLGALYLWIIPRDRPGPAFTPPVAENTSQAPSLTDTSSAPAVMDTAGAGVAQPEPSQPTSEEPAPAAKEPAATRGDTNSSPLKRPGGIDVDAGGVTLVVASTPSRTSADAVADRFRKMGYTAAIFYGDYGGVTRYRVGVGQFEDTGSAEAQLSRLPGGFPGDTWLMAIRSGMEIYQ